MYCPLKLECLQGSCAWWDKSKSCCAILSLVIKADFKEISNITNYITKESSHNGGTQEGL